MERSEWLVIMRYWRCARPPAPQPRGPQTCTPGARPAAPSRPSSGSDMLWARPTSSCPASTTAGRQWRRSAEHAPPDRRTAIRPVRVPGAGSPSHTPAPEAYRPCRTGPRTLQRHTALHNRPPLCQTLAHRSHSQVIQPQERRQIRTGESSLRHAEVLMTGRVAASSSHDLDPHPTQQRTHQPHPEQTNRPYLPHPQTRRAT